MAFGFNFIVLAAIVAVMLVLRWRKVGLFTWALSWWVAVFVSLKLAFVVPVPSSVRMLYMAIVTAAIFAYVSSSRQRWSAFTGPILKIVLEPRLMPLLVLVVFLIPAGVAFGVYRSMNVPLASPQFGRTVHPAPPDTITVHETEIDLANGHNPLRDLESTDPEAYQAHLENGRKVYFQNCFFCHGDAMAGDGMFAHALNPIPSNFIDPGVLPMFQETFIFWRVSKGGPGLPEEGGPWDTAMPAWELFLTEQEMWEAVMYLYEYTNFSPRAREEHH